jgi:hypothetical protein
MSSNLYLTAPKNKKKGLPPRRCDLLWVSSAVMPRIYRPGDSVHETLIRYFGWLEEHAQLGAGALLDHRLEVALFLVESRDAKWSAW